MALESLSPSDIVALLPAPNFREIQSSIGLVALVPLISLISLSLLFEVVVVVMVEWALAYASADVKLGPPVVFASGIRLYTGLLRFGE